MTSRLPLLALALLLSGCDIAALLADPRVAQREADAKAIGGACRYGLRSIEDCYQLNTKASKAAVFAGWKEMDQYMRDNKVEGVASKMDAAEGEATTDAKADKEAPKEKASAEPKAKAKPAPEKTLAKAAEKPAVTP
jgi:hypothetical protein